MLYKKARERKSAGADRRCSQGALSQVHSAGDQANFLRPVRTTPQLRSLSDFQGPTSASSCSTKRRVCIFRVFCLQERFSGAARLSRAPKNARHSAKARACSASHIVLRSCRRIPGASIFKDHMLGGCRACKQQHTFTHTHTRSPCVCVNAI